MTILTVPLSPFAIILFVVIALCIGVHRALRVPAHLRHIPMVPIWPLLLSYLSGEVDEQRIRRLFLPFAKEMNTGVVLVYCLGTWTVQVLEPQVSYDPTTTRSPPSDRAFLNLSVAWKAAARKSERLEAATVSRHASLEADRE